MYHLDKQNQQETSELNDIIDQKDLTENYLKFHPMTVEHIYFSAANWIFSKIDHTLRYKTNLKNIKKWNNFLNVLDQNGIKLKINSKQNYRKYFKTWRVNKSLLNDQWVMEQSKRRN
jgi:hypothetical protein